MMPCKHYYVTRAAHSECYYQQIAETLAARRLQPARITCLGVGLTLSCFLVVAFWLLVFGYWFLVVGALF